MKAAEVYKLIRSELSPAMRALGYQRTKGGFLGWAKQAGQQYVVCWFQVSRDGWDDYAGSKFVLEFQIAGSPAPGSWPQVMRDRVPYFLNGDELGGARELQNKVIQSLRKPPANHWVFDQSESLAQHYRTKFEHASAAYKSTDDIWFRYSSEADVGQWLAFLTPVLRRVLGELEQRAEQSGAP